MGKVGALKKRDAARGRRSAKAKRTYKSSRVPPKPRTYSNEAALCRCDRNLPCQEGRVVMCCKCGKIIE